MNTFLSAIAAANARLHATASVVEPMPLNRTLESVARIARRDHLVLVISDFDEIDEFERQLQELNPGLEQVHQRRRASLEVLREAEEATERWREDWDRVIGELAEAERYIEVEQARIEQISTQQLRLERDAKKLGAERAALSTAELERSLKRLIAEEQTLKAACDQATRDSESVWRQIRTDRERDRKISTQLDRARGTLQENRGRLTSLEALQEAALGTVSNQVN